MKIAIIGAGGTLGSSIADEANERGHDVTPLGRASADITDPYAVECAVGGQDVVVAAVKGPDRVVPRGAATLLEALPAAGVRRLVFIGGGATLLDSSGRPFIDAPDFPAQYLETARDQAAALDVFRSTPTSVEWSYVSPPPVHLEPGVKSGNYRVRAGDTPIVGDDGDSRITVGDLAAAVLDTIENRQFIRERFTAAC